MELLLVAVKTSRTITHKERVDPKEFKEEQQRKTKKKWMDYKKNARTIYYRYVGQG